MSINPVLVQDVHDSTLIPLCGSGESYILTRKSVDLQLKLSSRVLMGKGSMCLTTHRIVFIKKEGPDFDKVFSSISLPFLLIKDPKFHQPIFSSNHFDGLIVSDSLAQSPLESNGSFSLKFTNGGCELFLKFFYLYYAKVHNDPSYRAPSDPFSTLSENDRLALVDPADPSQLYFTQPNTTSPSGQQS